MDLSKKGRNRAGVQSVRRCLPTTPDTGSSGAVPKGAKGSCHAEQARRIVAASVAHQVPGRFGRFAGQGLGGDGSSFFSCLAVKPPAGVFIVASGKVGCFDKGPCEILVAASGIVFAFGFAVARPLGCHGAAVAGVVFRAGEAVDVRGFKANDSGQDPSDSREGVEAVVAPEFLGLLPAGFFDAFDVAVEVFDPIFGYLGCQLLVAIFKEPGHFFGAR